ncbi:MAG: ATP-binding protein [Candidatus Dormibacteraceae bacterium]
MSEATAMFHGALESVGDARHFVQRVLLEWGAEVCDTEASLLITELATNSVIHAKSPFDVTMTLDERGLRISVSDRSSRLPLPKTYSMKATTGRGLRLVAAYADAWGVEPHRKGKTVWCALRFDSQPGAGPAETNQAAGLAGSARRRTRAMPPVRPQARGSAGRTGEALARVA